MKDEEGDVEVCELTSPNVIYTIDGLDCANCAAKIEEKLNKTEGILGANVDFLAKKLTLQFKNSLDQKSYGRKGSKNH